MRLRLAEAPRSVGLVLLGPLVAVVIAVVATSLLITVSGTESGVGDFWSQLLSKPSDRILVDIVNQSAMLFLSAVAAAIGFRMGLFNIGVEGQYLVASYAAAALAGAALLPGLLNVALSLVAAMVVGALWALLAGLLRVGRGISEVITTIMLNRLGLILVPYFANKYGENLGNSTRTKAIPESSELNGFQPFDRAGGTVWGLVFLAVVVGLAFWFVLSRTRFGFDLRATGISPTAAAASGVNVNRMILIAMGLSGAVAGLVWLPALFGDAHSFGTDTTFQAGIGFSGIAVALLGRNRVTGMIFGSVLFSFLTLQANTVARRTDISANLIQVTQGIAVLAVVIAFELVARWRTRLEQRDVGSTVQPEPASLEEAPA